MEKDKRKICAINKTHISGLENLLGTNLNGQWRGSEDYHVSKLALCSVLEDFTERWRKIKDKVFQ